MLNCTVPGIKILRSQEIEVWLEMHVQSDYPAWAAKLKAGHTDSPYGRLLHAFLAKLQSHVLQILQFVCDVKFTSSAIMVHVYFLQLSVVVVTSYKPTSPLYSKNTIGLRLIHKSNFPHCQFVACRQHPLYYCIQSKYP